MKQLITKLSSLSAMLVLSTNALAHGDHAQVSPSHGIEHMAYYGVVLVIVYLGFSLCRRVIKQKDRSSH